MTRSLAGNKLHVAPGNKFSGFSVLGDRVEDDLILKQ